MSRDVRIATELKKISNGKINSDAPQFPGTQKGNSIEEVRKLIKQQKRCKGFEFVIPTGASSFDINISGAGRLFLGFALLNSDPSSPLLTPDNCTLKFNEETVIDKVKPFFFTNYLMDDEYYFIPRPMSGTDDIKFSFQNSAAPQTWWMIVYYI